MIEKLKAYLGRLFPVASLRAYIVVMTTVVTLPLIVFTGYLMFKLEADERSDLQRETVDDARAISRSIERRLQEMATSLNLLAQFPELESNDLPAFQRRIHSSLAQEGLYVIVATKDGQQKLNTRLPSGETLGKIPEQADLSKSLSQNRITVSNIFFGNTSKQWVFNVTLPLPSRLASTGDALIMTQNAADLRPLISTENLPADWSVAVLDDEDRVIISSEPGKVVPGEAFTEENLLGRMSGFSGNFLDDHGNVFAYSQFLGWSWKTVIWGPASSSQVALVSTWRNMMIGSVLMVLAAITGAYIVGRQLRSSILEITDMAERIGQGEIVAPVQTKITEANQVAIALSNASFDRSQAEDHMLLVLHELVHRSKNILTLVQAMMRQLARENTSIADFQREVDHRLRGLGMSIRALTETQWQGLPIKKLIETHLDVFGSVSQQVVNKGEDFMLSPEAAQNLGLILHELTTNSIKYGALSVKNGIVEIEWQQSEREDGQEMMTIYWREKNGPAAEQPSRKGFGSTIVKRHAEGAFSGVVAMDYAPSGFAWTLTAPTRYFIKSSKTSEAE